MRQGAETHVSAAAFSARQVFTPATMKQIPTTQKTAPKTLKRIFAERDGFSAARSASSAFSSPRNGFGASSAGASAGTLPHGGAVKTRCSTRTAKIAKRRKNATTPRPNAPARTRNSTLPFEPSAPKRPTKSSPNLQTAATPKPVAKSAGTSGSPAMNARAMRVRAARYSRRTSSKLSRPFPREEKEKRIGGASCLQSRENAKPKTRRVPAEA